MKKQREEESLTSLLNIQKRFPGEKSCRDYLIQQRWNGNSVCIKCGSKRKFYRINNGELLKCADCKKQFSPKVGTIFEDSALPLKKWFYAIFLLSAHKKGVSSCQLARDIQVTQKTAWFMLHRIRYGISTKQFKAPLTGTVEVDETYVGGKHHKGKRGRGSENKTPVFGMAERQGEIRAMPVEDVTSDTLQGIVRDNVKEGSNVMTDEWRAYNGLNKYFDHKRINHRLQEYANNGIHVNNIENFWSLLKRGILGIYHHVSSEHLHRYCDEFQYRYNTRNAEDSERFSLTLTKCEGRLQYKELICG